ncbi:MAG: DegV family protein [Ruminococcaceae bacterium]|nr:DegV family protein [Oscillospiraceae bacterium]
MSVKILVDSGSDILPQEEKQLDIEVLPLKTRFGEEEFLDGVTLTSHQFYEKLVESDELPQTSQITPAEYEAVFEKIKQNGDSAVCITISSKFSGCFQSARIAADDCENIYVVDSENVCIGQRILVEYAVKLRDSGASANQIAKALDTEKKRVRLIALLDTLEYLKKGGRISSAVAIAGTLLSIKPVISVDNGEVSMLGKARGSKNGNNMLIEQIGKANGICFDMPLALAYSGLSDELLKKYISDSAHLYDGKTDSLPIYHIGSTIGTHVGPGAVAIAFFANN